jgi:hypothetical protein
LFGIAWYCLVLTTRLQTLMTCSKGDDKGTAIIVRNAVVVMALTMQVPAVIVY